MIKLVVNEKGQTTVECGLVLVLYIIIICGLIDLADFGILVKRVLEATRYIAWNSVCNHQDGTGIIRGVYNIHDGEVLLNNLNFPVLTDDSPIVRNLLGNTMRRVESTVTVNYSVPYSIALPGDAGNTEIIEKQIVDVRGRLMLMPPKVVIHDPEPTEPPEPPEPPRPPEPPVPPPPTHYY
jgi:hypothetical protein